ncbi:MAG: hypothetical protein IKZ59_05460 [Clostridia bacterium]|nr:hypothetical protein [Clostridia bacterium]
MSFKRILCVLLAFALTVCCLSGCKKKNTQNYDSKAKIYSVETGIVASNDALSLKWDNDAKCIFLENRQTGKIWSPINYNSYLEGVYDSSITLTFQNMQEYQRETRSSTDIIDKNKISCKEINNGVEVTYYFDDVKIAIPVTYTLREDSLLVGVDASKAIEGDSNYRIYSVAPASGLCSVLQEENDAYMLVPYGSGGIINTTFLPDGHRKINEAGRNVAALSTGSPVDAPEDCGFQIFGIKDRSDALFGIAEDCPGAIGLSVSAGDRTSDYSNVYPVFYFIDFDDVMGRAANSGEVRQLSERTSAKMSVGFYPLSGEEADYNGMARCYKEYLIKNGYINENGDKKDYSSPYALTVLGGVETTSSVAGVPSATLKTMTTFSKAQEIISDAVDYIGVKPVVRLHGFGESGINYGEIAGGYGFSSKLGSDKERLALQDYCKEKGISVYTQFEMLKFNKSGNGFSTTSDVVKTATMHAAESTGLNLPLRDANDNVTYRLLARDSISEAVDKLIKIIDKKKISGVCVSSLGAISYSDYSDPEKYSTTNRMESDTKEYINRLVKSGTNVAGSRSTYFAVGLLDTVFEAPLETSGLYQIEYDIPFYQMVFSGVTPLYSAPVNTDSNPKRKIMLAAASGTGLGFAVIDEFDKKYMENNVYKLYACLYESNKASIKEAVVDYQKVYNEIAGCEIERFEFIDKNISKTVFSNGKIVYANHSFGEADSPVGTLEGFGFKLGSEG